MGDKNKVQFNLKNVHYAMLTVTNGTPSWSEPVSVPGAVTLGLDPQGSVAPFYADGIVYYQAIANNGYSGDLEIARFPDQMLVDVWGFKLEEKDKVLLENSNVEPKAFALLYQIDGDKNNDYYCLYNCSGTRPGVGGETNTESKTPKTRTSTISAVPLSNGNVLARTTSDTPEEVRQNWFKKVYEKSAEGNVAEDENTETGTTDGESSGDETTETT